MNCFSQAAPRWNKGAASRVAPLILLWPMNTGSRYWIWSCALSAKAKAYLEKYRLLFGMRLNALDWLNFFLADVRGGLGAYLNVFLLTKAQWSQAAIGAVLMTSGLIGIMAHPAVGAFIDHTRAKRALVITGTFLLSGCGLVIVSLPVIPVVLIADMIMAVLGGVFAPAVAAITLGLCGKEGLPVRLGRNAAFDRAGNVFIAALIGIIGLSYTMAPFYLAPLFALLTTIAALSIPPRAIDHNRARGLATGGSLDAGPPASWRALIRYRPLLIFAAAAALFHFANAPMLPLVVQRLALANPGWEMPLTSAAIIVAQLAMILMALLVTRANDLGRKPLLLLAFAAVPLRGGLAMWFDDPAFLLAVQVLDGVGGGLFEALLPLVLADIMGGTGHYSLARGLIGTIQGVGGSSSQFVAGYVVTIAGYNAAFLSLAIVALVGLLVIFTGMPETTPASSGAPPRSTY
jgi:MFS family permease